eukprot:3223657-Pleurochrysis_carterae.AAC.1
MAPLNSPARRVVGAAWRQRRRRRTSSSLRRGKENDASSASASGEIGLAYVKSASSPSVQFAIAARVRQ